MPWTSVPNLKQAMRMVDQVDQPNAGLLVDALHFDRSQSLTSDIAKIPKGRLHYWQICDGPAERPATTEAMMHAARCERLFPGEGGIDLVSLVRAMPADITISIETPTVELAKTVDATTRARRALAGRQARAGRCCAVTAHRLCRRALLDLEAEARKVDMHGAGARIDAPDHGLGVRQADQRAGDGVGAIVGGGHGDGLAGFKTLTGGDGGRRMSRWLRLRPRWRRCR